MVSKKILISGLMVTLLGLTGCSGLQDMINNKIAETAKEVSTGVNSAVKESTDALKAEGEKIEKDLKTAGESIKKQ